MESVLSSHPNHDESNGLSFPGMHVELNFITEEESQQLINGIDGLPWDISQSGRRKQVNVMSQCLKYRIHLRKFLTIELRTKNKFQKEKTSAWELQRFSAILKIRAR